MLIFEGSIVTVNQYNDVARYLVEDKGRILYVGENLPPEYAGGRMIHLGRRALVPAFVDTHQHFASFATFHAGLNVMDAASNVEMGQMIRDFASKSKAKTLICFGASPYSVAEKRLITRQELDAVCPDKELMVIKYDGHACVVNSKVLERLNDKVKDLRGYHPDTGEMNQEAFFKFSDYLSNSIPVPELLAAMQQAMDFMADKGFGCVHTVSGVGFPLNLDITLEQIFAKGLANGFQLRVFPQSLDIRTAKRRGMKRIGGCFECALDGCFGSHDAAMQEPYADAESGEGVLYYSDEKVIEFCKQANRAGLQIELHAIGDKAFDQACRAIREALLDYPREDHRHGIIHACLPTSEGIEICRQYQIQLPVQSAFINWKQEPDEYLEQILGRERTERLNPIRTFLENAISVSMGSDAPCTTPDPILWMDRAVNNPNRDQAISVQDALRMCTYNGYYATFDEEERGSLEEGKIADMVILSENPYEVPADKLSRIKVEKLLLGGKVYKKNQTNIAGIVARGLANFYR